MKICTKHRVMQKKDKIKDKLKKKNKKKIHAKKRAQPSVLFAGLS
jgi:hypothetical protein